jgi:hypothetical protein
MVMIAICPVNNEAQIPTALMKTTTIAVKVMHESLAPA